MLVPKEVVKELAKEEDSLVDAISVVNPDTELLTVGEVLATHARSLVETAGDVESQVTMPEIVVCR